MEYVKDPLHGIRPSDFDRQLVTYHPTLSFCFVSVHHRDLVVPPSHMPRHYISPEDWTEGCDREVDWFGVNDNPDRWHETRRKGWELVHFDRVVIWDNDTLERVDHPVTLDLIRRHQSVGQWDTFELDGRNVFLEWNGQDHTV